MPSESKFKQSTDAGKESKRSRAVGAQKETLNTLGALIEGDADAQVKQTYQAQHKQSVTILSCCQNGGRINTFT